MSLVVASALAVGGGLAAVAPAQAATAAMPLPDSGTIGGVDVSTAVTWTTVPSNTQFAYIEAMNQGMKANSSFYANWAGATQAGIARGAYAFGTPNKTASNGATQAEFFYTHGGALSTANAYSLPPALDLELNSSGTCWGLSLGQLRDWVTSFITTFKSLSGVTPVIYTTSGFWKNCVDTQTLNKYPLWVADPGSATLSSPGFGGATTWKFRQTALDQGSFDYDEFKGSLASLQSLSTPRISGVDRYATSLAASLSYKPGVNYAYVASGTNYPDALSAGAAAGKNGGPVVLTLPTSLPSDTRTALSYLKPKHIVVVGGTTAVSSAVYNALRSYSPSVTRVSGADRTATSAAIAKTFAKGVANAYIAMDNDWPDALAGSALAASAKGRGPMLLVEPGAIPSAVKTELSNLRPQHITVLGGTAVVQQQVVTALAGYTASRSASAVSRIAGSDRFATSARIAAQLHSVAGSAWNGSVYVASGVNYPDALVGGPMAALTSSPVLLTAPSSLSSSASAELKTLKPTSFAIIGGTASISTGVQASVAAIAK